MSESDDIIYMLSGYLPIRVGAELEISSYVKTQKGGFLTEAGVFEVHWKTLRDVETGIVYSNHEALGRHDVGKRTKAVELEEGYSVKGTIRVRVLKCTLISGGLINRIGHATELVLRPIVEGDGFR